MAAETPKSAIKTTVEGTFKGGILAAGILLGWALLPFFHPFIAGGAILGGIFALGKHYFDKM